MVEREAGTTKRMTKGRTAYLIRPIAGHRAVKAWGNGYGNLSAGPAPSTNVEKSDGFFLLSRTPLLTLYLTVTSRERLELP
jgi:hypothetical protein